MPPMAQRCVGRPAGCRKSSVRRVLLLRRIELDVDGFFLFIDIEDLAESLVALGIYLNLNAALGDTGKADLAFLVGARFKLRADILAETVPRMFGIGLPPQDHLRPV